MELLPLSWRICLHGPFAEVPREAHCGPQEQQKEQVWARMFLTDTLEPLRWPKIEENRVAAVAKHRSRLREDFFADTIHLMVGRGNVWSMHMSGFPSPALRDDTCLEAILIRFLEPSHGPFLFSFFFLLYVIHPHQHQTRHHIPSTPPRPPPGSH